MKGRLGTRKIVRHKFNDHTNRTLRLQALCVSLVCNMQGLEFDDMLSSYAMPVNL